MPTVVSSRALVPVARRARNPADDDEASKALVVRQKKVDLSKALIVRPADDGRDNREALVLYRKQGGPAALRELAEWHKSSTLLPPFRREELLRIAESQFLSCLSELKKLQDPLYFHDDILDTIKATREYALFQAKKASDPLENPTFVTQAISSRIHNAYFRTAAWQYVRDHARRLEELGLEDVNVYAQLKGNSALCVCYIETYEMLRQIEASGQHEVGLLASASPYYIEHFKDNGGNIEWDSTQGVRLNKSLVDTIVIEMILPQSRYPMSILMLCLRDAIAGGDTKTTQRFTQGVFDAIGDLSVTLQLLDMMDTPISAADAKAWRLSQSENINAAFTATTKESQNASSHVAGINSYVVPLTKTKTPATLEKMWESINQTYVSRTGSDIDVHWGLEYSMNPEPQWSALAMTRTKEHAEDTPEGRNTRALMRKGQRSQHEDAVEARRQRRLEIANEPTTDEFEGMPDLIMSEEEYDSDEEYESDDWSDTDDELEEADREEVMRQYYEMIEREKEQEKAQAAPKAPEPKSNIFKSLFRSLKGRFLTKNPILSVDPQPPRDDPDEDDEVGDLPGKKKKKKKSKKKGTSAGEDDMPPLESIYPIPGDTSDMPGLIPVSVAEERLKNAKPGSATEKPVVDKGNVKMEEVVDEDAHKPGGSSKKKKKNKKKKPKKAGEPAEDDDEPDEPPAPQTPATSHTTPASAQTKSPQSTKSVKSPKPAHATASASSSTLYTPQPETAQSGLSYMKSEGISVKTKVKSRPEEAIGKLGSFMSRTFGRGKVEEPEPEPEPVKKVSGMAERLRSYMKSVNARAFGHWERILGMDDSKGQSGMEWNDFVRAMVNLGFEYDESSAGSRVRFDPPNKNDKSYTTHKPHPDPWLHPKRVKDIARDLNKMYGFDKDMLFELPKTGVKT